MQNQIITSDDYSKIDDYDVRIKSFIEKYPSGASIIDLLKNNLVEKDGALQQQAHKIYMHYVHNKFMTDEICDLYCSNLHRWMLIGVASNTFCTEEQIDKLCEAELKCGEDKDLLKMASLGNLSQKQKDKLTELANSTKSRTFEIEATIKEITILNRREGILILALISRKMEDNRFDTGTIEIKDVDQMQKIISQINTVFKFSITQTIWIKHSFDSYSWDSRCHIQKL